MSHSANITEIFSSLQGEGVYTGTPTVFVRFSSCGFKCAWCDTAYALCDSAVCRVTGPDGLSSSEVSNPISATALNELIAPYESKMLSITGGEPLNQSGFLAEWLPSVSRDNSILLETNGVLWQELKHIVDFVHVVSMDFKLPSSAGCQPVWSEHEVFLKTALGAGKEVYIKIVVTEKTSDKDIQDAIAIISRINKYVPVVIQPASPTLIFHDVISGRRLNSISRVIGAYLPNVRVSQQMHKEWGIR